MTPTKDNRITDAVKPATILHLVTPKSAGKPLCGETARDAVIGAYCEHLDGDRWIVEVFKDGKPGTPCKDCLIRYSSALIRKAKEEDGWPLFVMLAKIHLAGIGVPFLVWIVWLLCKWLSTSPYPPRMP